jgi:hypothetical protein
LVRPQESLEIEVECTLGALQSLPGRGCVAHRRRNPHDSECARSLFSGQPARCATIKVSDPSVRQLIDRG